MPELFTVENAIALVTLTAMEIVLGIDNIVFIAILAGKLDKDQQGKARRLGLALAMIVRILLLLSVRWMLKLENPLISMFNHDITGKDLIMLGGGGFLIAKATYEIHHKLEGPSTETQVRRAAATFQAVIVQIVLIDIVFSLDSVITAVGMAKEIYVMIAAVMIAVGVMMFAAGPISGFVDKHPTVKMLALSFLLLIGVMLVADGCGQHIPKGYVYVAMAFSLFVEILNLRVKKVSSAS